MPSELSTRPQVCVTLDLEEDHAGLTDKIEYEGLAILPEVRERLRMMGIPLSVFVAGNFLRNQPGVIKTGFDAEFHSHAFCHPPISRVRSAKVREDNIARGVEIFREFFGHLPPGFRAPYGIFKNTDYQALKNAGVRFDSSQFQGVHVSGLHLLRSAAPKLDPSSGLLELPLAADPWLRVPYSLSFIRLLGLQAFGLRAPFFRRIPDPLVIGFHLHDLVATSASQRISFFWRRVYGSAQFEYSWALFESLLQYLQTRGATFITMNTLYERYNSAR